MNIEVIDPQGLPQLYTTQDGTLPDRNPLNIGNVPNVDLPLRNKPTGRWHVQVFAKPCQVELYNVGSQPIQLQSAAGNLTLSPRQQHAIPYNQQIKLDDHRFTFYAPRSSKVINLEVAFPTPTELTAAHTANNPLEGVITLHNDGEQAEVQFNLRVEGLPEGAYRFGDSNPKLSYIRQESIKFWVYHPGYLLPHGTHCLQIYAEAPHEYPHEVAVGSHALYVPPHYSHSLKFG